MPDHTPIGTNSLVIDMARRFATERLAPGAAAREKAGAIEPEIVRELGELGIFGATTPAQWDGSEIDPVTYALLLEEIAAGDGSVSTMVSVHNSPTCIIFDQYGTDAQKDRWLRPLATGAAVGSFALTEPQAGSDASNLRTRAVKQGDRYVINGAKQFISSASVPGSTVLFAVTDPAAGRKGISCFVVDKATQGYVVARREEKLGQKASETCALAFEDMEVPEDQRIGAEGEGYRIALSTLESGRIGIAAQSVGMARAALDYAVAYAKERQAFGGRIIDFQAVGFRLVDAKTKLEAARQMTLHAARLKAEGHTGAGSGVHGKVICQRGSGGGVHSGDPDAGRLWVSGGLSGGTHLPRCAGVPDLRGHVGCAEANFAADAVIIKPA